MQEMDSKQRNIETGTNTAEIHDGRCLNCGTVLEGSYCHECGQKASSTNHSIKDFMLEYLNNAYMWDPQLFTTIWQLATRPGYLTRRFLSGKIISHSHPLKLNMFLLFVFITFFVFFHESDKLNKSVHNFFRDARIFSTLQVDFLNSDKVYGEKIKASGRDTVELFAPLTLAEQYPQVLTLVEVKEDTEGQSLDKWIGVVPSVFLEDSILVRDESGYYCFNREADVEMDMDGFAIIDSVGSTMIEIINDYILMIILFTVPFLSLSVSVVQRKRKVPMLNHFIFSLHYTAMIELVVLLIYLAYISFGAPMSMLQWILILGSNIYLILAFREVYGISSWYKAILKTFITNVVYITICCVLLVIIFFVSCYIVAQN